MLRWPETIEPSTGSGEWFSGNSRSNASEFRKKNRENTSRLFLISLRSETRLQREESWSRPSSVLNAPGHWIFRRRGGGLLEGRDHDSSLCKRVSDRDRKSTRLNSSH